MQDNLITFNNVDLGYGRKAVLTGLCFTIERGSFFGIVGPNGTGKTTILKAILGMLRPMRGQLQRDPQVRFSYVPQRQTIDEVYPLTVMDVATMGRYPLLGLFTRPSEGDKGYVKECLEHVGIADLASKHYRDLSGGQKQRTLIARALAAEPQALILDEPTNDMDIASEHTIMELMEHLNREHGITVVVVSHLLNVLANYAETFALVDEKGLKMVGPASEVLTSETLSTLYGFPIEVAECSGKKVVFTGGRDA